MPPHRPQRRKSIAQNISLKPLSVKIKTEDAEKKQKAAKAESRKKGLIFKRVFTKKGVHPFSELEWEKRDAKIKDEKGATIFDLKDVEVPKSWSQLATDIVASKYLRKAGVPKTGREVSVKQVILRIAKTIRKAGESFGGYFNSKKDAAIFEDELTSILVNQRAAFNSPVWFNCGLFQEYGIKGNSGNYHWNLQTKKVESVSSAYKNPQCSACFIQSVSDDIISIFDLLKNEAKLFKYGSGTGTNFSKIRGKGEKLSGGGTSSGLISFLEVFDRGAGSIKSGGTTRRAAKMVILDIDHPEIMDFIRWKTKEEEKAKILIESGKFSSDFNGEAYKTISGQNSNNSVRLSDDFMETYLKDGDWSTYERTTGKTVQTFKAKKIMEEIAQNAWACADPGIQFDTTINSWHTCPNSGRINGSNPCSEFMFLDDSACNLASINLQKYLNNSSFEIDKFRHTVEILITAMEILVDFSSYPTPQITKNSHDFRPLGLGFANLGSLLMTLGIPYDSEKGRGVAAAITAILHSRAYAQSAKIAQHIGPFSEYKKNRSEMLEVIKKHKNAVFSIDPQNSPGYLLDAARKDAEEMLKMGKKFGFRNSQVTNIAPTGTISLLMDCDTTGIEPDFALVKFKKLAGGGFFKIVNNSVPQALKNLGYSKQQIDEILTYAIGTGSLKNAPYINSESLKEKGLNEQDINSIEEKLPSVFTITQAFGGDTLTPETLNKLHITAEKLSSNGFNFLKDLGFSDSEIAQANTVICGSLTLEGAPHLAKEHLPVFDCASRCGLKGTRIIEPMGHVKMMAAVQPFISGAISKTVNLPDNATVKDVEKIFLESWRLGIKAISIYRDGSKGSQPLSGRSESAAEDKEKTKVIYRPLRRKLPDDRNALTHKFSIGGHKGFVTVGLYEDGSPGEIFITMSKEGTVISGLLGSFATSISYALQYGVPLRDLVNRFSHIRFEPSGFTKNPQIPIAKSIVDYIFRWLAVKFLPRRDWEQIGIHVDQRQLEDEMKDNHKEILETPGEQTIDKRQEKIDFNKKQPLRDEPYEIFNDAPTCDVCGGLMTRSGTCYKCINCGSTSGCS